MANVSAALKSIVLRNGECVTLPKDAVIESIIVNGSISATSDCGNLPAPTTYRCGVFLFFLSISSFSGGPLDEVNTYYISLKVGNNTYIMNQLVVNGNNPGTPYPDDTLNLYITDTAIFEFKAVVRNEVTDRQLFAVYFQVAEDLWDETELKISDRGTFYYLKPNDATCEEYPTPE